MVERVKYTKVTIWETLELLEGMMPCIDGPLIQGALYTYYTYMFIHVYVHVLYTLSNLCVLIGAELSVSLVLTPCKLRQTTMFCTDLKTLF